MITNVIISKIVEQIAQSLYTKSFSETFNVDEAVSSSSSELLLVSGIDEVVYKTHESELTSRIESVPEKNDIVFDLQKDIDWDTAKADILNSLNWSDLKTGEISELESIIYSLSNLCTRIETMTWLNNLFLELFNNPLFISTLLHTLSHMDYDDVIPYGPTMAMAALNHKDDRVVSYAVKAFYNWNSKVALEYMKSVEPKADWINTEWKKVIEYLEKHGDD